MRNEKVKRLVLAGVFLALGYALPFLTGQIKEIGNSLLPMHLPVMLCGIVCGWQYGFGVGLVLPITRSLMFGMPPMYPTAICMAPELATYGLVIGILYSLFKKKSILGLYVSLVSSMACGRMVWGLARVICAGLGKSPFSFEIFITAGFLDAIPGIILQLILIPLIISVKDRILVDEKSKISIRQGRS